MNMENQTSEENPQTIKGNSEIILLIALIAFIVFISVAAFMIMFYTEGLYYPGWGPYKAQPFLDLLT